MNPIPTAPLLLLAIALWCWPDRHWVVYRVIELPSTPRGEPRWLKPRNHPDDPFAVAAALELFAVGVRGGLPVATAAAMVSHSAPTIFGARLSAVSELLELGADADHAWSRAAQDDRETSPVFDELSALARRSARAGSALSQELADLADNVRQRAEDGAVEAAERAGVAISGPLGLCFLPAFVCLGIVPVVIGLAEPMFGG